jgi:hypothetical protein
VRFIDQGLRERAERVFNYDTALRQQVPADGRADNKKAPTSSEVDAFVSVPAFGKGSSAGRGGGVLLAELVHAAGGIDDLLLAGIEGMAVGADFNLKIVSQSRPRLERIAAGAANVDFCVVGMRIGFHGVLSIRAEFAGRSQEKGRAV